MKIYEEGFPGRFYVQSESDPDLLYLVDLFDETMPGKAHHCSCPAFEIPFFEKGIVSECKHIRICYQRLGRTLSQLVRQQMKE